MKGLSILRAQIQEAVAGTLAEVEINTPVDASARMAMAIQAVTFELVLPTAPSVRPPADGAVIFDLNAALSTRSGLTAMPDLQSSGTIAKAAQVAWETAAPADAGVGITCTGDPIQHLIYPADGLIVADRKLSLYVRSTGSVVLVSTAIIAIYYRLVKLSLNDFIAALSLHETL